jgi:hypothetical protein
MYLALAQQRNNETLKNCYKKALIYKYFKSYQKNKYFLLTDFTEQINKTKAPIFNI